MKMTPQDIIDKEFRTKFRGFDMAEVDTFLEEVAENFFKLIDENTSLNEKVLTLQEKMESRGSISAPAPMEFPAELSNFLEELKQDTAAISAELASLKQDRSVFVSLEKNFKDAVASLQKSASTALSQGQQVELPTDLENVIEEFKKGSGAINAELAALKEGHKDLISLKKSLESIISSAKEAGPASTQQSLAGSGDLAKTLDEFRKGTEAMAAELAALKKEAGSIQQVRKEIRGELQELLKSYFEDLDTKFSKIAAEKIPAAPKPKTAPEKKEKQMLEAIIEEEPEGQKEDTRLPDYEEQDETHDDDGALEFLSEDDILDVDKLRDIFQSALDDSQTDSHKSREEDDDSSADLLFLEDVEMEDEHEPEVTFSMDEGKVGKKSKTDSKA
jgi:cell division initiation protein